MIIKRFIINNLFSKFKVDLDFNYKTNIFVGENGLGKTTILSCIYYVLSGKLEQLYEIDFENILVEFEDEKTLIINHNDIIQYVEGFEKRFKRINPSLFDKILTSNDITMLKEISASGIKIIDDNQGLEIVKKVSSYFDITIRSAELEVMNYFRYQRKIVGNQKNVESAKIFISNYIKQDILFFPTYRRIEEDIKKLGLDQDSIRLSRNFDGKLIQFGMKDVEETISTLMNTIKTASIGSYNEMTATLLEGYLSSDYYDSHMKNVDVPKLKIALDRIGSQISDNTKNQILQLVSSREIYSGSHSNLLRFVEEFVSSYNKQELFDLRVKDFVNICNKYLNNKAFVYNESEVNLAIFREDQVIKYQYLSSGEKQMISLFSKLFLENQKPCIILIDEPELSLSLKWQRMFIPDILKSNRCDFLIAVTHSPFIFDNEYDHNAKDLSVFIS